MQYIPLRSNERVLKTKVSDIKFLNWNGINYIRRAPQVVAKASDVKINQCFGVIPEIPGIDFQPYKLIKVKFKQLIENNFNSRRIMMK